MSGNKPPIPPRSAASAELDKLLSEIPEWDDALLRYMHRRFATSRLFRVRHDPDAPMTERARTLHATTEAEMKRRGLEPLDNEAGP